jgi:hypothetical protein
VVRRARGILRGILTCLLSIVAGFVWRVEGGGGNTKKDDAADRMDVVWDVVTGHCQVGGVSDLLIWYSLFEEACY